MSGIVFGGPAGSGKRSVYRRILGRRDHPLPSVTEEKNVWTIDTKYFTAKISVAMAETPDDVPTWDKPCEGLVLVFDSTSSESFTKLEQWLPFVKKHDPEVFVVAANKYDLSLGEGDLCDHPAWLEWCLDHGAELVTCSATRDEIVGNRDAEGVERLIEAVGSHPWGSMVRKTGDAQSSSDETEADAGTTRAGTVDYSKWDKLLQEELPYEEMGEPVPEAEEEDIAEEDELQLDLEAAVWLAEACAGGEEEEAVSDIAQAVQNAGLHFAEVFKDSSVFEAARPSVGPNATLHLNLDTALRRVAQVLPVAVQAVRQAPSVLRIGVRYGLWGDLVDRGRAVRNAAADDELLARAFVWGLLESCAAETPHEFHKRVTYSSDAVQLWFETAVVAVMMRVTQSTCRRTDYVREVLSSAEEHKEIGNVRFKTGRWDAAMESYSIALRMVEQFYDEKRRAHVFPATRDLAVACHLNTAACALKKPGAEETAVQQCSFALALDPENPKALFRRGRAFLASKAQNTGAKADADFKERKDLPPRQVLVSWAVRDLTRAAAAWPSDKAIASALQEAQAEARKLASAGALASQGLAESSGAGADAGGTRGEGEDPAALGQLLGKLRSAREDGQSMTDEQRRERAAMAAAEAVRALGIDDEDESSEGGGGDDDE